MAAKLSGTQSSEDAKLPWEVWVRKFFPNVCFAPFAERHIRVWEHFENLVPGERPRPRIEIWGRGGAKSSTIELCLTRQSVTLNRHFALYVCSTQDKADEHVQSIANLMGEVGIERSVDRYGRSEGWRRSQLQTSGGFFVAAYGLNTGMRGVKIKEFRPDMIILDDVDELEDSPKTTEKKIRVLTSSVLPAGSSDCAIIGVQNLIHEESVFAQLQNNRADFLLDRVMPEMEPAVVGLEVIKELQADGRNLYRITEGKATWEGQNLDICQRQINDFGIDAFQRESQHVVAHADGYFFDHFGFRYCDREEVPRLKTYVRSWDLAATQDGGDFTVGVLMGITDSGVRYILDVRRHQYESNRVRNLIKRTAEDDRAAYGHVILHLPKDPGQAGVDQSVQYRELLQGYAPKIESITGSKAVRARGWQKVVNGGNAVLVRAGWNQAFTEEHRKFREDEEHAFDDQVDASADCENEISSRKRIKLLS